MSATTVTPAIITEEYLNALKTAGLIDRSDIGNIAAITRQVKSPNLNRGKGYGNEQIRNFLYRQYTTTPEMVQLIMNYFSGKKKLLENTAATQKSFVQELSEAHVLNVANKLS